MTIPIELAEKLRHIAEAKACLCCDRPRIECEHSYADEFSAAQVDIRQAADALEHLQAKLMKFILTENYDLQKAEARVERYRKALEDIAKTAHNRGRMLTRNKAEKALTDEAET